MWKKFLTGAGMANRENSLNQNTVGCFDLMVKRKQLLCRCPSENLVRISTLYIKKINAKKNFFMDEALIILLSLTAGLIPVSGRSPGEGNGN